MPMWTDVIAPPKKLPRGRHWMTYNLLKSVCLVFQFDHHSAVQFLSRYLVHPTSNFLFLLILSWIKFYVSKGWEIHFTKFWLVVFKEYAVFLRHHCSSFKKTDQYLSVDVSEYKYLLSSIFFGTKKSFFMWNKLLTRMSWERNLYWILSFLQCCSWEVERGWVLSRRLQKPLENRCLTKNMENQLGSLLSFVVGTKHWAPPCRHLNGKYQ